MKYFIAIALIAAVASAAIRPTPLSSEAAEIQEIIAAIQSPSTDPATAAALEQMLLDVLGVKPEPVAVGPALVNPVEGISVGPAIIPDIVPGPAVVAPAPAEVAPIASTPMVQIILNINHAAAAESSPISVGPAVAPEHVEIKPEPVQIVESAPEPVQVVEVAPEPVQVVEVAPELVQVVEVAPEAVQVVEVAPEPVQVVEVAPEAVEPVQIGVPIIPVPIEPVQIGIPVIPEAAVVLPEELN